MRSPCLRLCSAALVFLVLPRLVAAQKSAPDPYAGESMVLERADLVYSMNADGTGSMQKTVAVKIQTPSALQQVGIIGMEFAANSQHMEFHYVRVRRPDGSVTETPVSDVIEQPLQATVQAPFYSDLKVAQIPVKNLQVGDTLEWEGRVVTTKPVAPNEFWGAETLITEDSVVREQSVELRVPATKAVTVWTNPALNIQVKESKEGDEKIYRWESSALKPTVGPEADAAKEARKKHVLTADEELDAEQGKLPSVAWTTFPSWAAVGAWYRGLESGRAVPDAEIKAKVAELTAGKTSEEDKVRVVYAYVSTQIRYIGVAFGIGRYQPHEAVDVLHNQYGDCKDKATLLTAMLAAAGVPSDAALIGLGVRFNEAVPSPGSFNHLITHLKFGGKDVWLDSTEEVAPYKMIYATLRDREALVVPSAGDAMLERTPASPPFDSFQTWTAKGSLDTNGISDSHIAIAVRGDDELVLRTTLRQMGPAQYDEFAQRLLNAVGYAGTSSHAEFSRPEDTDAPFTINLDYHREKAGDWDNLKLIPQLAPTSLPVPDEKQPPVATINLGTPRTETSTAEMKLPAGWTVELPEAVHEKAAFASYDLSYRFEKGTLYSERRVTVLQQKIPAKDWKTYKKWTDSIGLGNEPYVQLRRAAGKEDIATSDVQGNSAAQIQELLDQLDKAYKHNDAATMETLLTKIKALNPRARRLLAWTASLAILQGKLNEAIADNRKELEMYPDEFDRYAAIIWIQGRQRDTAGIEATLRSWAKADPTDYKPLLQLAQILIFDNQAAGAVDAANEAIARVPEGAADADAPRLALGQAEMKAGMTEKARMTLATLLKATENPGTLNDAAYLLADAKLELPLADASERTALAKLTAETESWTLDEAPATLRAKTTLLLASWDTMGWILFREGKPQEAKSYIEAAWTNRPNDEEEKKHLDQVNASLGISEKTPHHAPVSKADVTVTATAPPGQEMRTIPLGPANGRKGVAEYRLLLSHGQVERTEPVGEKTIEGGEEMMKHADLKQFFPEGSDAKLVRGAMLNCFMNRCQLVLEP